MYISVLRNFKCKHIDIYLCIKVSLFMCNECKYALPIDMFVCLGAWKWGVSVQCVFVSSCICVIRPADKHMQEYAWSRGGLVSFAFARHVPGCLLPLLAGQLGLHGGRALPCTCPLIGCLLLLSSPRWLGIGQRGPLRAGCSRFVHEVKDERVGVPKGHKTTQVECFGCRKAKIFSLIKAERRRVWWLHPTMITGLWGVSSLS